MELPSVEECVSFKAEVLAKHAPLRPIRVGSDCTGLGAEGYAFNLLGLEHRTEYLFASEKDAVTRNVFESNHPKCQKVYESCCLVDRDLANVPAVDCYIAGAPCQSWSLAGKQEGCSDDRGKVLLDVCAYIVSKRPCIFVLEQVEGILKEKTGVFKRILGILEGIKFRNQKYYQIEHKVVNTASFTHLPQNRPRVYIVGAARSSLRAHERENGFTWPSSVRPLLLSTFLSSSMSSTNNMWIPHQQTQMENLVILMQKIKAQGFDPTTDLFALDILASARLSFLCIFVIRWGCGNNSAAKQSSRNLFWATATHFRQQNTDLVVQKRSWENLFAGDSLQPQGALTHGA